MYLSASLPPLPVFIKGDKAVFQPGQKHFSRTFHLYDLILVTEGVVYIEEDGRRYSLQRGDFLILRPRLFHTGWKASPETASYYWCHFYVPGGSEVVGVEHAEWAATLLTDGTFTTPDRFQMLLQTTGTLKQKNSGFASFKNMIEANYSEDPEARMRQQVLFFEFLLFMQRESLTIPSASDKTASLITSYIQAHYRERSLQIKDVAAAFLYHPDYVTKIVKQKTGLTALQFLQYQRLRHAKKLLLTTNNSLDAVAQDSGFKEGAYFSRLFKQKEGMTPGEYRRRTGN
ncbi:helix-turn-helix transcriptional regulator [Alkalicoccus urumqiensis]|nr:AraC family transcriptional regulator [Alkalicoccus urumqiensis]